jgi:hypothetical protein
MQDVRSNNDNHIQPPRLGAGEALRPGLFSLRYDGLSQKEIETIIHELDRLIIALTLPNSYCAPGVFVKEGGHYGK